MRLLTAPVLLCAALAFHTACAADTPDEAAKQAEIFNSRGSRTAAGYEVGRSLFNYAFTLSPAFRQSLGRLGAQDRWLDVGAGEGNAVLDYATGKYDIILGRARERSDRAQAVAITIEDRRTARWHETAAALPAGQVEYRFGRRLREYTQQELGRFQLISDVLGGFTYTRYPSVYMAKALSLLDVNGNLYTLLPDVQSEHGENRPFTAGSPFLTRIERSDGSELRICSWLKRIACVEVTCELNAKSSPRAERYHIRKVCPAISVPPLELTDFVAGAPPERRFRAKAPAGDAGAPGKKR